MDGDMAKKIIEMPFTAQKQLVDLLFDNGVYSFTTEIISNGLTLMFYHHIITIMLQILNPHTTK